MIALKIEAEDKKRAEAFASALSAVSSGVIP
jgi:hypothetical protein